MIGRKNRTLVGVITGVFIKLEKIAPSQLFVLQFDIYNTQKVKKRKKKSKFESVC